MDARATRRPRRRRGAVPGGAGTERREAPGRAGTRESAVPWCWPRARGPRRHATTARAPAGGGAQELHSRRDRKGAPASGELWPGRGGTEGLVGGSARVVRGRGAYGGCSAAPARGSERGARQSSSSGKSIRRSASGAELGATIDRCQMNTCGPEQHAVGEGRLGHGASLPARGRALGARVAARLGSGAPHLSVLSALRRPPTFKYSVDCDDAWRVAERRSSAVPLGISSLGGARGRGDARSHSAEPDV